MTNNVAALIAFFALGANVLAAALHLLFNPSHRLARWFIGWTAVWILVLFAQGMSLLPGAPAIWMDILGRAVFMLPILFLAFGLVMARRWSARSALCLIGTWLILMLWRDEAAGRWSQLAEWMWYGAWFCGLAVMSGCRRPDMFPGKRGKLTYRMLMATLFLFVPVTLVASFIGGNWYGLYAAPVASIVLQFLVFVGVVHFRFYDVEVSAARRGDIAARAAEAERLAVVGELAASVAHEVRNPLTGVSSLAQRLADDAVDDQKRREYARVILSETRRVEEIVTSLLTLAKGEEAKRTEKTSTELQVLFDDLSLLLTRRAADSGVAIRADAADITVVASREALSQALLNLLLNALDHLPVDGTVDLVADRNGDGVDILVQDSGPGIPFNDRDKVFEPFYTGSGGTGLGLALVRRVAREQGWVVSVDDSPSGGAEFCLRIPT